MRCSDCNQKTKEFLVWPRQIRKCGMNWDWPKTKAYCREHLIARFREEFVKSPQKMIVCYPNLEEKHSNYEYVYLTLSRMQKGYAPEPEITLKIVELFQTWMRMINGKCPKCGFEATTAYFGKGVIPYEKVPAFLGFRFDYPMIHQTAAKPEILCKSCAFGMIEQSFQSPGPGFEDGVLCPDEYEEGIYLAVEV
jgi:hypothetical protein